MSKFPLRFKVEINTGYLRDITRFVLKTIPSEKIQLKAMRKVPNFDGFILFQNQRVETGPLNWSSNKCWTVLVTTFKTKKNSLTRFGDVFIISHSWKHAQLLFFSNVLNYYRRKFSLVKTTLFLINVSCFQHENITYWILWDKSQTWTQPRIYANQVLKNVWKDTTSLFAQTDLKCVATFALICL